MNLTDFDQKIFMLRECVTGSFVEFLKHFLSLFYLVDITDIKDRPEDVPNYEILIFPFISILVALEQFIRLLQRKHLSRFEDCVINIGSALIFTLTRVFLCVLVVQVFDYIYTNYRIVDLPLHSVSTWFFSLLLVEFVYYWAHRALHELNILWAAHQFHHMAEDVNITTTIRDSVVDLIIYDVFPIPLSFLVPPQILLVHMQFSLIFQIWLHNEVVGHLGPLEYIINTPRKHCVHHGKNPYCIDKNYGALLTIWDLMFGTFQQERRDEKIVFGVVSPTPQTFDPITLQFGYYRDVLAKFRNVSGFWHKIGSLLYGPGWSPGKPRLGLLTDIPKPDPDAPKYCYQPHIDTWKKVYIYVHGMIIVFGFYLMADHPIVRFSPFKGLVCIVYVLFASTSFGAILDNRWFAGLVEVNRCLLYFAFDFYLIESQQWSLGLTLYSILKIALWNIRFVHLLSMLLWIVYALRIIYCSRTDKRMWNVPYTTPIILDAECNFDNNCKKIKQAETDKQLLINGHKQKQRRIAPRLLFVIFFLFILTGLAFIFLFMSTVSTCSRFIEVLLKTNPIN